MHPDGVAELARGAADPRRHAVLAAFCVQNFMQCFCFLDFSTDVPLTKAALNTTSDADVGLLYYGGFASTLPAMIASLWLLLRGYEWTAGLGMSLLIVGGAWLRYVAVSAHSFGLALLSTVMLGMAGGVIFTSFTFLPARWFPEHERAFATALAAQSNYAGWAAGCLGPLLFGSTLEGFQTFMLWQAIVTSIILPIQLLANSRGPVSDAPTPQPPSAAAQQPTAECSAGGSLGLRASLSVLAGRPQYLIHSTCYAVLGAVGYAVTGVVDECFSAALGASAFSPQQAMWLNVAFVLTGVLTGLCAGRVVPPHKYGLAIRSLFALGTAALLAIQLLLLLVQHVTIHKEQLFGMLLVLMTLSGAGTLGFINISLRVSVAQSRPVDEIYAGSLIEFALLGIACGLGLLTYLVPPEFTFCFFAIPALVATIGIFACARFKRSHGRGEEGLLEGHVVIATLPPP